MTDRTMAGLLRSMSTRLTLVERRLNKRITFPEQLPQAPVSALLHGTYRGAGDAQVSLDGGATHIGPLAWMTPYIPWASRRVNLGYDSTGNLVILGHGEDQTSVLTLESNWLTYNEENVDSDWANPRVVRLISGIVVLSGLIEAQGTPTADSLILTLPTWARPDTDMLHYVNQSDTAKAIRILANGRVEVSGSGWTASGFVSLDGIAFPAAGVATWTDIGSGGSTWGANFEAWTASTNWGTPAFWKDPFGFVWFRGLVRVKTATSSDNTSIALLPATHRANLEQHFRTAGNEGFSGIGARPGDGINWKVGSIGSVGAWLSLTSVLIATSDTTTLPWSLITEYANSWAIHAGSWPPVAVLRRADGLCMGRGLISGGTLGTGRAFVVPQETWPRHGRLIIDTMANGARGRVDFSGDSEPETARKRGGVQVINGSNAWVALDGLKWMAGR